MEAETPRYASLRDYLSLLRKQWLLIVIPVVVAMVAALAFSLRETKTYQATAQVLIQNETQQLTLLGTSVLPAASSGTSPVIVAQTANTPALAGKVKQRLHTRLPAAALPGHVALGVNSTTGLLTVTATAGSAQFAAALANAYAQTLAATTTATVKDQFKGAARALQRRLHQLNPRSPADQGERATLLDEISRLDFLQATSTPGQVASIAAVPGSPASPKPVRNVGLGLLAGLLLGLVFAFVREAIDRRLRGSAEVGDELELRVVGQVRSKAMGQAVAPTGTGDSEAAGDVETFRILRNNIELLMTGKFKRALIVTSALPEEGKSTVAASLALASAAAGRQTLLVEADLRRPSLAQRLGLAESPGLTDYLTGKAEVEELLRSIPPATSSTNGSGPVAPEAMGAVPLRCLLAGNSTAGSTELLASDRMALLLDQVTDSYELVVVDTAPLLPVADTLQLLPLATAAMLCVRSGRTTREQARAARSALSPVAPESLGIVVTDLRARDEPAGYGLYPYYYSYAPRVKS